MIERIGVWGHANQGINDGFGYAGYKLCSSLNKYNIKTLWHDTDASVALSFTQPHGYGGEDSQYRIGYTPWESTIVPEEWPKEMNERDEIWTTSQFCKKVFESNGIKKEINILHHGIDLDEWTTTKRETEGPFIFFHMGEPADRKGGQLVFDAFQKVFKNNPNVYLYFKAHSWVEARWFDGEEVIGPVDAFPRVMVNKNVISREKLNQLYNSMHCLVYPSNGEGFGLIPFQGMATGLPTIYPAWGGLSEFKDYGVQMDYTVGDSGHDYHVGEWCWPDFDSICERMKWVYENYEQEADTAYKDSLKIREKFSWDAVIQDAIRLLNR
jgi:glycosyltransferase involved in cell wall biosynthesis